MSILDRVLATAKGALQSYAGDKAFLAGAVAAAALVTAADGQIDESEIAAAIKGMQANKIVGASYSGSQIEEALTSALNNAKTRAGKIDLKRSIEALLTRPIEARQDVFLIAADIADDNGIGEQEKVVLFDIGKLLNLDANKLLAA